MLTGDENIVDINFTVFWVIKDAKDYLFNIRNPDDTVKSAAESAMREVIGHTEIASALAEGRAKIETDTQKLLQEILDSYHAGIEITQRAAAEGRSAATGDRRVPRRAERQDRLSSASSTRPRPIATTSCRGRTATPRASSRRPKPIARRSCSRRRATPQRFISVYNAYKVAQDVTARRLYIETMQSVLKNTNKIILDKARRGLGRAALSAAAAAAAAGRRAAGGAAAARRGPPAQPAPRGERRDEHAHPIAAVSAVVVVLLIVAYSSSSSSSHQTEQALVLQFGKPIARRSTTPACTSSCRWSGRGRLRQPHPRFRAAGRGSDRLRPEAARGRHLCPLPHHRSAAVLSDASAPRQAARTRLASIINGALRRVIGNVDAAGRAVRSSAPRSCSRSATR